MKLLALFLFLVAPAVHSANWVSVSDGLSGTVSVDKTSITSVTGGRKAWVRYSYAKPQEMSGYTKKYGVVMMREIYSCAERSSATIQEVTYEFENPTDVLTSHSRPIKDAVFTDVIPGTHAETILDFICRQNIKKKAN